MNKTIQFLFAASFALIFSFIFTGDALAACVTGSWVNIAGDGVAATANVTNSASCAAQQVSMCSYRVYIRPNGAGWLSTQTLFDSQTVTVQPGQTITMSVDTDNCMNQVDAFTAASCPVFTSDKYSGSDIFLGKMTTYQDLLCTKCTDKCVLDDHECSGSSGRTCLMGNDGCTYWEEYQSCDAQCFSCGDTRCECGETKDSCPQDCGYHAPTVGLNYTGNVTCNQKATLQWTSTNATECSASGSWSGSKAISGSEQVGNFTGSRTYNIACSGSGGSVSDSVTIYGTADDLDVDAGPDKYIDAGESVRLDGSVDGDYDYLHWSCTGGSLSDYDILRPTYRAPYDYDYDYSRAYTCTLTARNECGSDSDTMRVHVEYDGGDRDFDVSLIARPKSDCAPLYDVDMIATVSNWRDYDYDYDYDFGDSYYRRDREFTYYFDCENDGSWDKTITTNDTSYTAVNLCDYRNAGSYTARVRVERGNRTATDTEIVRAESCGITQIGNVSITKTVNNVSTGTGYQGTVTASPLNTVSYRIVITGTSGTATNVTVSDAIPSGITNVRDVQVDGYSTGGNIASGISLGTITSGQTKTITYNATVANETSFIYGQTTLNNVATVTVDGKSANSSAAVQVYRRAVMGATTISTGIGSDTIIALEIALLAAIACLVWVANRTFNIKRVFAK